MERMFRNACRFVHKLAIVTVQFWPKLVYGDKLWWNAPRRI